MVSKIPGKGVPMRTSRPLLSVSGRKRVADPRNISKPSQPKRFERAMPITDSVLKTLTDQQALVVFDKLTPKINRALEPQGKKVAIVNLTEEA
jgi:hypothetical protein